MANDEIRVDVSRARSGVVGAADGITPSDLRAIAPRIAEAHTILRRERAEKKYGFYDLHTDAASISGVKDVAARFLDFGYDNLVILGIGGSALGITALNTALNAPYYNLMTRRGRKGHPRLFVMDNIDPVTFRAMLRMCPPKKTLYNIISKSGGTAETMSQLLILIEVLEKKLGKGSIKEHLVVTTSPEAPEAPKSLLHGPVKTYGLTSFPVPVNVGGRFSVFSSVGLFPAAMLGLDIDAMAAGCAAMDARCSRGELSENPAYLRAAIQYLMCTEKGKTMSVMMPYADGLRDVSDWYRQLWAESLGKRFNLAGEEVFTGQTPIKALGATDQHSQVQLYTEGPNDKLYNILEVKRFEKRLRIPETLTEIDALDYLRGQTMNRLMATELQGTLDALKGRGRPVIRVTLPRVNGYTVAQLLYMLEVETAMSGRLYGIDAFDQPGVEAGKIIARELMGKRKAKQRGAGAL